MWITLVRVIIIFYSFIVFPPGYEADGEHDQRTGTEIGESCDEHELSSQVIFPPFPACFVPVEVRQRLWSTVPLYQCINLLKESIKAGLTSNL